MINKRLLGKLLSSTSSRALGILRIVFTGPSLNPIVTFSRPSHAMFEDGVTNPPTMRIPFASMTPGQFASYGLTFSRPSHALYVGPNNMITFSGNNLLLNSVALSTQSVSVANVWHIVSFKGTGQIVLSGAASGTVVGTGVNDRVFLRFKPSAGTLTLTVTGSVTNARLSAVTHETSPRTIDDYETTGAAYYGPRFELDSNGNSLGLLVEPQRTNDALWCRDLTNAVWVKTSCTATLDLTGIDGLPASASTLTATGANATCLQTVTAASAARAMSAYVRRINGSGVIQMTTDNGTTWTTVTVTSSWTRVDIPTQTLTNPVFGFRIVTSGDAIAVDFVMNEGGTAATNSSKSSPLYTQGTAVTRAATDGAISNISSFYNQSEGTIYMEFDTTNLMSDSTIYCFDDGTTGQANQIDVRSVGSTGLRARVRSASASSCDLNPGSFTPGQRLKLAFAYKVNDFAASLNGAAAVTDTSGALPATTMTQLIFGRRGTTGVAMIGHILDFRYYNRRMSDAELAALTA